jgi:hypothetical protein
VSQSFVLTVDQPPVFTSAARAAFAVGRPRSFTVATSAFPAASLSVSGALPAGVRFTPGANGTATLSGTPAAGTGGVYPLKLTAANGISPDAVQSLVLVAEAPPSVVIRAPARGARFTRTERVVASYRCREGAGGPGISSCAGTVASGRPIDTTRAGRHSFTVTAISSDGLSATGTVTYTVRLPSNRFTVRRIRTFADGTITFAVTVPGPGRIDVLATAWNDNLARVAALLQPAAGRFVYARAHTTVHRNTTVRIRITPNPRGSLLVEHHTYPVVLRLWVSYTPTGGLDRGLGFYGLHLPNLCHDPDHDHDCDNPRLTTTTTAHRPATRVPQATASSESHRAA